MNFKHKQFKDLWRLAIKESPFQFNNKYHTQTGGVAKCSCLTPTFPNAFYVTLKQFGLENVLNHLNHYPIRDTSIYMTHF